MKRTRCLVRASSWLADHTGVLIFALAAVWMASVPRPAWGQSAWPSYPNNSAISVTSSGNVGIGTASPDYKLVVNSGYALGTIRIGAEGDYLNRIKSETHLALQTVVGADLLFVTGGNFERMRVTNGGGVGIGTTNPGSYKLAVEGTIGARDVIVTSLPWSDYVYRHRIRGASTGVQQHDPKSDCIRVGHDRQPGHFRCLGGVNK